jgi:hypothetical protein
VTAVRLPYAHLNLRRNPFGELFVDDWAALARVDVDSLVARLQDPRSVSQFVGEKGYGKTTHLLALSKRFPLSTYVHLPEGQRTWIPAGDPLLIDEAQRLTPWQRYRVFRSPVALVLGTHQDFTAALQRAGRRVQTVEVGLGTDAVRLHAIVNARIEWARRDTGAIPEVRLETVEKLLLKFGPNIRGALHELYGTFQNLHEPGPV